VDPKQFVIMGRSIFVASECKNRFRTRQEILPEAKKIASGTRGSHPEGKSHPRVRREIIRKQKFASGYAGGYFWGFIGLLLITGILGILDIYSGWGYWGYLWGYLGLPLITGILGILDIYAGWGYWDYLWGYLGLLLIA
jgi:hypothetical protein